MNKMIYNDSKDDADNNDSNKQKIFLNDHGYDGRWITTYGRTKKINLKQISRRRHSPGIWTNKWNGYMQQRAEKLSDIHTNRTAQPERSETLGQSEEGSSNDTHIKHEHTDIPTHTFGAIASPPLPENEWVCCWSRSWCRLLFKLPLPQSQLTCWFWKSEKCKEKQTNRWNGIKSWASLQTYTAQPSKKN